MALPPSVAPALHAFREALVDAEADLLAAPPCRPVVTLTYAQSLDGSLAAVAGRPTAISCAETLVLTHALRALHDAILVGVGTLAGDDPSLTVRHGVSGANPVPVVVDPSLRTPLGCRLLTHPGCVRPVVLCDGGALGGEPGVRARAAALQAAGAAVVPVPALLDVGGGGARRRLDLRAALDSPALAAAVGARATPTARGRRWRLMVEGGAATLGGFLEDAAAHPGDPLAAVALVTIAPRWLLGEVTLPRSTALAGSGGVALSGARPLAVGGDVVVVGAMRRARGGEGAAGAQRG